ncbi:MAG: SRPBCC domain-containing protein [Methanomassiliicoccus sp.]|nr:SRPBCC domain-containing protein [Methanomassiliicoccus sp.]
MSNEGAGKGAPLTIRHTYKADRGRLWKAWTDPEAFKIWWGPRNFTTPVSKMDLRVGGSFLYCSRSPEGREVWSTGTYKEIAPLSKLVFTDSFADPLGKVVPASRYGMPGFWPLEMVVTVRLEDRGGTTEMEVVQSSVPMGMAWEMVMAGWKESFDKLDEYLETGKVNVPKTVIIAHPGVQEIVVRRTMNAPRELVFRAFTDPDLIPQWWGPARYRTKVERLDPRPGGSWRFIQWDEGGNELAFRGVFHDVRPPGLIVQTFEFEPMGGHVELQTAAFESLGARTLYNAKSVYLSVEHRDMELSTGMEVGMNEGLDRLDELLERLKRGG